MLLMYYVHINNNKKNNCTQNYVKYFKMGFNTANNKRHTFSDCTTNSIFKKNKENKYKENTIYCFIFVTLNSFFSIIIDVFFLI